MLSLSKMQPSSSMRLPSSRLWERRAGGEKPPVCSIRSPGTGRSGFSASLQPLDGGDVLRIGRSVFVGLSRRTNMAGAAQLAEILRPYCYEVQPNHSQRLPASEKCMFVYWRQHDTC